MLFSVCPSL